MDTRPSYTDPRGMARLVYTVTITADVTPEQVIEEMSIEPADWAKLDGDTRWAVLRTKDAAEAALRIALRKENRPSDGFAGFAGRIMQAAEDHDCDNPEPSSLSAFRIDGNTTRLYWTRRDNLMRAADRFLYPPLSVGGGVR